MISEALINHLDRDEGRAPTPPKGPPRPHPVRVVFTENLRRSSFPSSLVPRTVQPSRYGWRICQCDFHFATTPPT
jgi:hypothetical protein